MDDVVVAAKKAGSRCALTMTDGGAVERHLETRFLLCCQTSC